MAATHTLRNRSSARRLRGARVAIATCVVSLLLAATACAKPAAPLTDDEAIAVATQFLDLFDAGKVDEAHQTLSLDLRNTLTAEDLQTSYETYARRGTGSTRGAPQVERIGDAAVVAIPVQRGQLVMQASITVGPERRIEGLFYDLDESAHAKPAPAAEDAVDDNAGGEAPATPDTDAPTADDATGV